MIDNKPTYTVRTGETDGSLRYYAAFVDGDGIPREAEINREVYLALEECRRHEQRQVRSDERHRERLVLSEGQLAERILLPSRSIEEAVAQAADIQAALASLTSTQRRRLLLYYEHGLSYEQIAEIENCAYQVITKSVVLAKEKLQKFFEGEGCKTGV